MNDEIGRSSKRSGPVAFIGADPTPPWFGRANCRGINPDVFIIFRGEDSRPARQICGMCVVRSECLGYALTLTPRVVGIWGGTSEKERRAMRRDQLSEAS